MKAMRLIFAIFTICNLFAQAPAAGLRRAPSFNLIDHKGEFHDLLDFRGQVVVLEIMKTDCPHCRAFSPVLEQMKTKYPGKV